MMRRASARLPTAPVATICIAMLPSAVASTGPAMHRPPGRVGGELVQQPIARSAADDLHFGDRAAGQLFERVEHDAVLEGEALEDRAGERRRAVRLRLAVRRQ